jgi:hypothetical protein
MPLRPSPRKVSFCSYVSSAPLRLEQADGGWDVVFKVSSNPDSLLA